MQAGLFFPGTMEIPGLGESAAGTFPARRRVAAAGKPGLEHVIVIPPTARMVHIGTVVLRAFKRAAQRPFVLYES